ncbi:MAG: twin-arginine translocation signal domain-containing protein, partial [Actinomycetota bacterium]|nr:twin-arginine translocation signal domain-containing protein [Actinomycetota bacterium]
MSSEERLEAMRGMNRRRFLKLSGAGIAGSALLGVTGSGSVLAQESSPGPSLVEEFEEAATEYGVPKGLLMAMGYVNARWEMPPPGASEYEPGDIHGWGGYGIMHLVKNPSADTLGAASELTGIPEDELKTDRRSNVLGGAALLAASQG